MKPEEQESQMSWWAPPRFRPFLFQERMSDEAEPIRKYFELVAGQVERRRFVPTVWSGHTANAELKFKLDHSMGADHQPIDCLHRAFPTTPRLSCFTDTTIRTTHWCGVDRAGCINSFGRPVGLQTTGSKGWLNDYRQDWIWTRYSMKNPRVLIVGDFCRSSSGAQYYNTSFALQNGFTRAGCNVLTFSDRDTARESALLPYKALGRSAMNRSLIAHAKSYQPHLVLFGHADMCDGATLEAARASVPGVVLAQFHVDPLFRDKAMTQFRNRGRHMDISFITTADRHRLNSVAARPGSVAFFPNPVDASIATANVAECQSSDVSYDGVFLGNGDMRREAQVTELMSALPDHFRFFAGGKIFGTPRLHGPTFLRTLASGTMSPNLPLDETRPVDFLYSSNRIAQLLVQGVVPLCPASAGLDQLYEDGIVAYTSIADLAEQMAALQADDARRRRIAATGWRIGRERTSAERVARYMLDMTLSDGPSCNYGWPTDRV
jgi:hypothetical protein